MLAFDIECTKKPLKFPDAEFDEIFMISYMVDGQGYLIINREVVSRDVQDFEYSPKPEYEGPFKVFNDANEAAVIRRFINHLKELRPAIYVTYNGDFFDWPFVERRCRQHGISMEREIGVVKVSNGPATGNDEWRCKFATHIDCLAWVKRDSYLPQGSHGLKAVTRAKLDYRPIEVDPENMVEFARTDPQTMASYSVSDAVATFYLYHKYVHPFIFSLCNIIPMTPDDVLRKGSGTLCETLLMVEAYEARVICPNKTVDPPLHRHKDHFLESETYVGGHVEALQSGVFHAELKYKFDLKPATLQMLIDRVDQDLKFALEEENFVKVAHVTNYQERRAEIVAALEELRDTPRRKEHPLIVHVDVGAMYPNIILTNRLQPPAVVKPETCAACDYFAPDMKCRRELKWVWRAEAFPASINDVKYIQMNMERESRKEENPMDTLKGRIRQYCQRVHKRQHITLTEDRTAYICQRENSFYVDTVKAFKDRRYVYKVEKKKAENELAEAEASGDALRIQTAEKMCVLYDSLQLAHKCILNSFYGYVMRKGARWYSMEMAGVVTHMGANIIKLAKELVDDIGIPLELDTDGLWCALPRTFPQGIEFVVADPANPEKKKKVKIHYACGMLNSMVNERFTNEQYHVFDKATGTYRIVKECSILFEIDGPYLAMILPAAKDEGKKLKKRYAVFNFNGSLAELKGFEIKRRGELQLIKVFQEGVFKKFLQGKSLEEVYASVAECANEWLDVLDSNGVDMEDEDLIDLISESNTMSKPLAEYGNQKSCPITCARRLAEFLGEDMIKSKGVSCKYVVSSQPHDAPVTERAVPTAIFAAPLETRVNYLKRWVDKNLTMDDCDIRGILDWDYYRERLGNAIRKIITIPAAMQQVENPVPRVAHPDWLLRALHEHKYGANQRRITQMFERKVAPAAGDIEDIGRPAPTGGALARPASQVATTASQVQRAAVPTRVDPALRKTDYVLWLQTLKAIWRNQMVNREKAKRQRSGDILQQLAPAKRGAVNMRGFLNERSRGLISRHWQIVEMAEGETPGELKVWVYLSDGSMEVVTLEALRTLYINSRVCAARCSCTFGLTRAQGEIAVT